MKRNVSVWQFAGFVTTTLAGTLLQFLYDWTSQSVLAAPFAAVNESTWEHMKLLFWPLFLFALIQWRFFREYRHFWCVKLAGTLTGLLLIPVLFYTYNGAFGKSPDWVNIVIFFLSGAAVFILETCLLRKSRPHCKLSWAAFAALCLLGVLFVVFTFITPQLPLFQDPQTGTFGISG